MSNNIIEFEEISEEYAFWLIERDDTPVFFVDIYSDKNYGYNGRCYTNLTPNDLKMSMPMQYGESIYAKTKTIFGTKFKKHIARPRTLPGKTYLGHKWLLRKINMPKFDPLHDLRYKNELVHKGQEAMAKEEAK